MQLTPEYWRERASEARKLAGVALFLEGRGSTLARELLRSSCSWDHTADVLEARHAQES